MNAQPNFPRLASLLAIVPDRVARQPSGVAFSPAAASCRHPERIAQIAKHLHWLTPLAALSIDDQRILGLVNAAGRPVHSADLEEGEGGEGVEAADPAEGPELQYAAPSA